MTRMSMSTSTYYIDRGKLVIPTGVSEQASLLVAKGKRCHLRATQSFFRQSAQFSQFLLGCRTERFFLDCKKENMWLFAHFQLNFVHLKVSKQLFNIF